MAFNFQKSEKRLLYESIQIIQILDANKFVIKIMNNLSLLAIFLLIYATTQSIFNPQALIETIGLGNDKNFPYDVFVKTFFKVEEKVDSNQEPKQFDSEGFRTTFFETNQKEITFDKNEFWKVFGTKDFDINEFRKAFKIDKFDSNGFMKEFNSENFDTNGFIKSFGTKKFNIEGFIDTFTKGSVKKDSKVFDSQGFASTFIGVSWNNQFNYAQFSEIFLSESGTKKVSSGAVLIIENPSTIVSLRRQNQN